MNDFSKDTNSFLYSEDYKEPNKTAFLDVSGSMGSFRVLPDMARGGESIRFQSGMSYYCAETAQQITDVGRCAIEEMLEELIKQRQEEIERRHDEINRSRNGMARIVLRGSSGS